MRTLIKDQIDIEDEFDIFDLFGPVKSIKPRKSAENANRNGLPEIIGGSRRTAARSSHSIISHDWTSVKTDDFLLMPICS